MSSVKLSSQVMIDNEQVWCQVLSQIGANRPALFLDRDGAMIVEENYLSDPEKVVLIEGAVEAIRTANRLDVPVIIVTNQSGIARGYFSWKEFGLVQDRLLALLEEQGAKVNAVYASPFHKSGQPPYQHPSHPSRKPNPGMLLRAERDINIDLSRSWIIGDKAGDLKAGLNAGLAGGLHVLTGHGKDQGEAEKARALQSPSCTVAQAATIAAAIDCIPVLKG